MEYHNCWWIADVFYLIFLFKKQSMRYLYIPLLFLHWHCGYERPPLLIICNILWYFVKYSFMQQQVADTKNHNCGIFWRSNVQEQPNRNFGQVQNLKFCFYFSHLGGYERNEEWADCPLRQRNAGTISKNMYYNSFPVWTTYFYLLPPPPFLCVSDEHGCRHK